MTEKELFDRLMEIRTEADNAGRWRIRKMLDRLINDRWGGKKP